MANKLTIALGSLALLAGTSAGFAAPLHQPLSPGFTQVQGSGAFAPPRMIEVAPGQWRSTYDPCHCDGGY